MLFKNLKTGNLIEPKDAVTAEMMERSGNYESYKPQPGASKPEAPKPAKKPARKQAE